MTDETYGLILGCALIMVLTLALGTWGAPLGMVIYVATMLYYGGLKT